MKDTAEVKTVETVSFLKFGKPEKVALELLGSGEECRIAEVEWDSGTLRSLYLGNAVYDGETPAQRSQ